MVNVLDDVKKLAVAVKMGNPQLARDRASWLAENMFGIEEDAKKVVQKQVNQLNCSLANFNRDAKYHRLSLEPLAWMRPDGYPKLAIFGLDSKLCKFKANIYYKGKTFSKGSFEIFPKLPKPLYNIYFDLYNSLSNKAFNWCKANHVDVDYDDDDDDPSTKAWVTISCQFDGVIPDDARSRIIEAKPYFETIFIIAEAKEWIEEKVVVLPVKEDPLAIGYADGKLWLIADFETTVVEDAMVFHRGK